MMKFLVILAFFLVGTANAGVRYTQGVLVIDPTHRYLRLLSTHPELSVDHPNRLGYEIYGPNGLQAWLSKHRIYYTAIPRSGMKSLEDYPTSESTVQTLLDLQKKHPQVISLIEIGKSVQGRPLIVAKITAPALRGRNLKARPEFKYIANMHGDEIAGRELMVRLISDLGAGYGQDSRITRLLDSTQVYIMASMNPDGANKRVRFNANHSDLNRSFPDFTTPDNINDWKGREPEIQAVMKFQAQHQFRLSANFHGGAEVVNYPWDTQGNPFPVSNFVQKISLDYARLIPYLWNSTEFKNGITNGFDWYEVNGGMQDWSYYWYRDIQLTIELTGEKWPSYSTMDETYRLNRSSLLGLIEAVHSIPTRALE